MWQKFTISMIWLICLWNVGTRRGPHCLDTVTISGKALGFFYVLFHVTTLCGWIPFLVIWFSIVWCFWWFHQNYSLSCCVGRIDKLMDGLKTKLESAYKASGGRQVSIITHSMGGLLVQCFLSLHSDVRLFSLSLVEMRITIFLEL